MTLNELIERLEMGELQTLLSNSLHSVIDTKYSDLRSRLRTAEQEISNFQENIEYTVEADPAVIKQDIQNLRADKYAEHIHAFLKGITTEQSDKLGTAIVGYLNNHIRAMSTVPGLTNLTITPSGAIVGTIQTDLLPYPPE